MSLLTDGQRKAIQIFRPHVSIRPQRVRRQCERPTNDADDEENVMCMPHQFLIAIENERLRDLERRRLLQEARREAAAARRARQAGRHDTRLGRRLVQAFGRRAASRATA
jgi:hypothetical protein